jgi:hypothetical protein
VLSLVPTLRPDPDRSAKILALLDRALAAKQAAHALAGSVDFYCLGPVDFALVAMFQSLAPEAEYAFQLWASAGRHVLEHREATDSEPPAIVIVANGLGRVAALYLDDEDTRIVDVDGGAW